MDDLARLNTAFNDVDDPPARLAERLADPRCVEIPLVADLDGKVVGFAALRLVPQVFYEGPYAELTELYVEPEHRRVGAGRALIEHAERLAKEGGAREMLLSVGAKNAEAQGFYRALGYADYALTWRKRFE
jgi:ribosomal protein S18 acetylase RimI-like enzyme